MGTLLSPLRWDPLPITEVKSFAEFLAEQDVVSSSEMNEQVSSLHRAPSLLG